MRAEIMQHKFIEFGKHQQYLYGIKSDSVLDVIDSGKMCIMDVHPQVLVLYIIIYIYVCIQGFKTEMGQPSPGWFTHTSIASLYTPMKADQTLTLMH